MMSTSNRFVRSVSRSSSLVPALLLLVSLLLLSAAVPLLALPITSADATDGPFAQSPTRQQGVDIPTWKSGEMWDYYTESSINYSGWVMDSYGNTTFRVNPVTPVKNYDDGNESFLVYNIVVSGEQQFSESYMNGYLTIVGNVSLNGHRYYRVSDLAVVEDHLVMNGEATMTQGGTSQTGPIFAQADTSYDPPMEELDFPLSVGETWSNSEELGIVIDTPMGGADETRLVNYTYTCLGEEQHRIYHAQAGVDETYDTYKIMVDDEASVNYSYYAPTEKQFVNFTLTMPGMGDLHLELMTHSPGGSTIAVEDLSVTPQYATIGETVTVSGEVTGVTAPGEIRIIVPGQPDESVSNVIGTFTKSVTAPTMEDDTPTETDIGSHGIIVEFSGLTRKAYGVTTISVDGTDLSTTQLEVAPLDSVVAGDELILTATVSNPSRLDVNTAFEVALFADDVEVAAETVITLESEGTVTLQSNWTPLQAGRHSIVAIVDANDAVVEYDEANNEKSIEVEVAANAAPTVVARLPEVESMTIDEDGEISFSVSGSDPDDDTIAYEWLVNDEPVTDHHTNSYTFTAARTGDHSNAHSPFTIAVVMSDTPSRPPSVAGSTSEQWTLTVTNIHAAPELVRPTPSQREVRMRESDTDGKEFAVEVEAPDSENYELTWRVNDELVPGQGTNYTYIPTYSDKHQDRVVYLSVNITDEMGMGEEHTWVIVVEDANRDPQIDSVTITDPAGGNAYTTAEPVQLSAVASDPDGDTIIYTWTSDLDGELSGGQSAQTTLHSGTHRITLTVEDEFDGKTTYTTNITVAKADDGASEDGDTDDSDEESPAPGVGLSTAAIALFALLLIRRRRR